LDRLRSGETLSSLRHRRFFAENQQRKCRVDDDLLFFRHRVIKNHCAMIGQGKEKKGWRFILFNEILEQTSVLQ